MKFVPTLVYLSPITYWTNLQIVLKMITKVDEDSCEGMILIIGCEE